MYKPGITKSKVSTQTRHTKEFLTGHEELNNQAENFYFQKFNFIQEKAKLTETEKL